jgi:DNA repair exonuclease SbcCD nuclease subunit
VHLGIGDDEERAFSGVIDEACRRDVDAILIAGDLFDHNKVSDDLLAWTARELDRSERPIVLLTGNHDVFDDNSVHHRFRVAARCRRVSLLDDPLGSTVEVEGTDLLVWGRAMQEHNRRYRPFEGLPAKPDGRWAVAAGHGLVQHGDRPTHHASPIAPTDLDAATNWDYVALGHHHAHRIVREDPHPAVYPGMTARSKAGQPGAVVVSFNDAAERSTTVEWVAI